MTLKTTPFFLGIAYTILAASSCESHPLKSASESAVPTGGPHEDEAPTDLGPADAGGIGVPSTPGPKPEKASDALPSDMSDSPLDAAAQLHECTAGNNGRPVAVAPPPACRGATETAQSGLVGYWRFDEGAGVVISDSSGNGNPGTVVQGDTTKAPPHPAPTWTTGKNGGGLRLDGIDDFVRVGGSASIATAGGQKGISITAWVKLNAIEQSDDRSYAAFYDGFGVGTLGTRPAASVMHFPAVGCFPIPVEEWVHLATVYDGITTRLFLNGASPAAQDVGWPRAASMSDFIIGAGQAGDTIVGHLAGIIDEVRLYNRELTDCEIQEAMK